MMASARRRRNSNSKPDVIASSTSPRSKEEIDSSPSHVRSADSLPRANKSHDQNTTFSAYPSLDLSSSSSTTMSTSSLSSTTPWDHHHHMDDAMSDYESLATSNNSSSNAHDDDDDDRESLHSRAHSNGSSNTSSRPTLMGHGRPKSSSSSNTVGQGSVSSLTYTSIHPQQQRSGQVTPTRPTGLGLTHASTSTSTEPTDDILSTSLSLPLAVTDAESAEWEHAMSTTPSASSILSANRQDIVPWFFSGPPGADNDRYLPSGSPEVSCSQCHSTCHQH